MSKEAGIDYPVETTYQPNEHILPLKVKDLKELNKSLMKLGDIPKLEKHNDFIIHPIGI